MPFSSIFVKLGLAAAALAVVMFLLHMYGDAKYQAGIQAQKLADQAAVIKQYQDNAATLSKILDNSSQAAQAAQAASNRVASGLADISAKFKGKTLAVIKDGTCVPSADFVSLWNSMSMINHPAVEAK